MKQSSLGYNHFLARSTFPAADLCLARNGMETSSHLEAYVFLNFCILLWLLRRVDWNPQSRETHTCEGQASSVLSKGEMKWAKSKMAPGCFLGCLTNTIYSSNNSEVLGLYLYLTKVRYKYTKELSPNYHVVRDRVKN